MPINIYTFEQTPAGDLNDYDRALHKLGIMKTVYVPVHPKVNQIKIALAKSSDRTISMFQNPHRRSQDRMHELFFQTYVKWSHSAVSIQAAEFPYQYPTNGSNEAIRETIAFLASQAHANNKEARIHVFDGEYEGYTAHANSHGVKVISHDRENFAESLSQKFGQNEYFYLSAPSGIDGNIWPEYETFLRCLELNYPDCHLMIDLAYLNTTFKLPEIRTDSPVIKGIFISMSKSFPGTYYDRIGGLLSKHEFPGLFGNKWFKNLTGLLLGVNLMKNSRLGEIPAEMYQAQIKSIESIKPDLGHDIVPSDVTFIATQPIPDRPTDLQKTLIRAGRVRYCLTPSIITNLQS